MVLNLDVLYRLAGGASFPYKSVENSLPMYEGFTRGLIEKLTLGFPKLLDLVDHRLGKS